MNASTICRVHGFGRIEVANAPMVGITRFFARNDVRGALADALAAAEAARRVGHQRGEMVAHMIAAEMYANLGALAEARSSSPSLRRSPDGSGHGASSRST